MRKLICFIVTNLLTIALFAQSEWHQDCGVYEPSDSFNYLIGGENRFTIDIPNTGSEEEGLVEEIEGILEGAHGMVWVEKYYRRDLTMKYYVNVFLAYPKNNQEACTIKLKNKKTGKLIKTIKYNIVWAICGLEKSKISDGKISLEDIQKEKGISFFRPSCQIKEFTIIVTNPREDMTSPYINKGGHFDEKTINLIKSAKQHSIIQIYDVKGSCEGDCNVRKLNGLSLYIK